MLRHVGRKGRDEWRSIVSSGNSRPSRIAYYRSVSSKGLGLADQVLLYNRETSHRAVVGICAHSVPKRPFSSHTRAHAPEVQTDRSSSAPGPPPPSVSSEKARASSTDNVPFPARQLGNLGIGTQGQSDSVKADIDPSHASKATGTSRVLESTSPSLAQKTIYDPEAEKGLQRPKSKRSLWEKVKDEAQHYWSGTKLLGKEIRISARLQWKLLKGKGLTRRERRQLKRTTQDLLRLIPFSVFVVVPFMELLLPVALRLFPNMLPSTFEDKYAADEKKRKLLKVRLQMAQFLQETIRESGFRTSDRLRESEEFKEFFKKVRSTGESPSPQDVISVAKIFGDDLTLDNLSRPQLVSMSRYMGINAFGTDTFLKFQIRTRLNQLHRDDASIKTEGVDSLTVPELQHACQSRGIRTLGMSPGHLRDELQEWINLHLEEKIPGTLLVLSKAFSFASIGEGPLAALQATLSSLPDNLLNEAELEVSSDQASNKQRLDVLQQQEELIEDEEEQEAKEEASRREKREAEEAKLASEKDRAREILPESSMEAGAAAKDAASARQGDRDSDRKEEEREDTPDAKMTTEQIQELGEALRILTTKQSVLQERAELAQLIEDSKQTKAEAEETSAESKDDDVTAKSSQTSSLEKRLQSMIGKIDAQLKDFENEIRSKMDIIQVDEKGQIHVHDVKKALRLIKHAPSLESINALVEKLDPDRDNMVKIDHVVELAQGEGLGMLLEDERAEKIRAQGAELKPKKEDVVEN